MTITEAIENGDEPALAINSNVAMLFPIPEDVKKFGYMRKQKTNKRKFFVLRLNSLVTLSKATLSYYDNEKKFRDKLPRRTILLTDCFAAARIPDYKKYVLGIYTKEDLLATIVDDEKQLIEWLQAIRSILYRTHEYHSRPLRDFHYIWQGNINRVSGGMPRNLMGTYRFCLMPTILYLIRVDPNVENPKSYEFPLSIIHRCGHKERTFYLRIGRLSELGAGEFWILTEDNIIAEHMHSKVSSFWALNNKGGKLEDGSEDISQYGTLTSTITSTTSSSTIQHRPRSSSTSIADQNKSTNNNNQVLTNHLNVIARNANNRIGQQANSISANHYRHYSMFEHGNNNSNNNNNNNLNFHSITPLMIQQFMAQFYPFCNNRNVTGSSSSQSPTNSRERLHSGSWSRTASDCSNEDLSGSSSTATTPVGPMYWDSTNNAIHQCSSPNFCPNSLTHSFPSEFTKANSSNSSLSTEFDSEHLTMDQFHSIFGTMNNNHLLDHSTVSAEERGFGADLDLYASYNLPCSSSSSTTVCSNCMHQYSLYYLQMMHQSSMGIGGHRSSNGSSSHNQSPVTSPKCHCSTCLHSNNSIIPGTLSSPASISSCCNNHHYLPTIPAGEPSDYVPMKPMNGSQTEDGDTAEKINETEESSYLHMAPLSPVTTNTTATSTISVSNSIEFNLEKVRSYISNEEEKTTSKTSSNGQEQKMETPVTTSSNSDDTIFNGLTRAYSTGSKPQPLAPSIGTQCTNSGPSSCQQSLKITDTSKQNCSVTSQLRTRASSTGSHGMKFRAFLLSSKRKNSKQQLIQTSNQTISSKASSCSLPEESSQQKANKAASAPILSSLIQPRVRSHTLGSKPSRIHLFHPGSTSTTPLLCSVSPIPDVLTNLYGAASQMACCSTYINNHCVHQSTPNHVHSICSPPQSIAPQVSLLEEGDLMEIDYSAKNKERSQLKQNKLTNSMGNREFEDEITREGKKKDNQQEKSKSISIQENTRNRSDSGGSTLGNIFGSTSSKLNTNTSSKSTSSHHPLDQLVTTFKHTLSFPHGSKHSKQPESDHRNQSELDESNSGGTNKSPLISNMFSKSLSEDSESIYSTTNPRPQTTIAPLASNESDEEESSYVLMAPENTKSNSNNCQKKQKSSTMRSLFSTISSSSSSSSRFRIHRSNSSNQGSTVKHQLRRKSSTKSESTSNEAINSQSTTIRTTPIVKPTIIT